jgi:DNA-directed RNA polymerase subunit L
MPHPLEHKVVLSVRTTHDNPVSIVQEALNELYSTCDTLAENFRVCATTSP